MSQDLSTRLTVVESQIDTLIEMVKTLDLKLTELKDQENLRDQRVDESVFALEKIANTVHSRLKYIESEVKNYGQAF